VIGEIVPGEPGHLEVLAGTSGARA